MGNTQSVKTSILKNSDSDKIRPGYYKNKSGVYYGGEIILKSDNISFDSFQKIKYGYAKTNFHIYYKGKIIPGVTPENFKVIKRGNSVKPELNRLNAVIASDNYGNNYKFGILL